MIACRGAPVEYIAEHRFSARFRAELSRRQGRIVAACMATVAGPTLHLALAHTGSAPAETLLAATPAAAAVAAPERAHPAPAGDDPWEVNARAAAATCPGLPAAVLLAIGEVETGLGRRLGPSPAGARGPMQFMPATWVAYGADGDGDGHANVMNLADAMHGAARLLCANGGADSARLPSALWNYNHSAEYVDRVLAVAGLTR